MLTSTRSLVPGSKPAQLQVRVNYPLGSALLPQRRQYARMYCVGWPYHSARRNAKSEKESLHQIRERRHALMRQSIQQYAEMVKGRLTWHQYKIENNGRGGYKIVSRDGGGSSGKGRGAKPQQTPDNPHGVRPGQNIEDAERMPMEHFLFGESHGSHEWGRLPRDRSTFDWSYSLRNLRDLAARGVKFDGPAPDVVGCTTKPESTSTSAEGSGIDPITNRRVTKQSPSSVSQQTAEADPSDAPTFKAYRSQFSRFAAPAAAKTGSVPEAPQPIHSDQPPSAAELAKYAEVEIDEIQPLESTSTASAAEYSLPASEEELQKYAKVEIDEIDRPKRSTVTMPDDTYCRPYSNVTEDIATYWAARGKLFTPEESRNFDRNDSETVPAQSDESARQQEELAKYKKTWGYDEVKPNSFQEDATVCKPAELHGYRGYNGWGYAEPSVSKPLEPSEPKHEELDKYKRGWGYEEPKSEITHNEQSVCDPEELDGYQGKNGWGYDESKGVTASDQEPVCDREELDGYKGNNGWGYDESKGAVASNQEPVYDQEELDGYKGKNGWGYDESKGAAASGQEPVVDPTELNKYKRGHGYRYIDPNAEAASVSDPVADSLKEYDNKPENEWVNQTSTTSTTLDPSSILNSEAVEQTAPKRTDGEDMDIDALRASDVRASMGKSVEQETWNDTLEQFGSAEPTSKLESSLSRQARNSKMTAEELQEALVDPYSKVPQGLETSFAEENGGAPTLPVIKRTYLSKPKRIDEAQASSSPTVYKILAYDPTMQSINVAETTSIVPDASSALTPPEVLLRLSNPHKFFPHFAPLQAEGFEIVSGSGDVLVFLKVRDAVKETESESTKEEAKATTSEPSDEVKSSTASAVNPIDMTGTTFSPVTGNYASPTGFVNYDSVFDHRDAKDLPPPPAPPAERFQSGINVRREEPVFSGGRYHYEGQKKRSLGKRVLIGAGWVAGISYALGVVGEYFKTGGSDGKGPKGL